MRARRRTTSRSRRWELLRLRAPHREATMNVRIHLTTSILLGLVMICPAVYGEEAVPTEREGDAESATTPASAEGDDAPLEANTTADVALDEPERREQARQHFQRGMALVRERRWEAALTAFDASLELYPTQSALFNSGICLGLLGRPVEAVEVLERHIEAYGDAISESERAESESALERNRDRLGFIEVIFDGSVDAQVSIDGELAGTAPLEPVAVDPGRHQVTIESVDSYALSRWVDVDTGASVAVVIAGDTRQTAGGEMLSSSVTSSEEAHDTGRRLRNGGWAALFVGIVNMGVGVACLAINSQWFTRYENEQYALLDLYGSTTEATTFDIDELERRLDVNHAFGDNIDYLSVVGWTTLGIGIAAAVISIPLLVVGYRRRDDRGDEEARSRNVRFALTPSLFGLSASLSWGGS